MIRMRHYRIKIKNKILFIIITLIIGVFSIFSIANSRLQSTILSYASAQTRKLSTLVINKAVSKQIINGMDEKELMDVTLNSEGKLQTINFNTTKINRLLTQTTNIVQMNMKSIEKGEIDKVEYSDLGIELPDSALKKGIIYEIPLGMAFNSPLLANIGPKVPVKFRLVGDVTSTVKSIITEYGINNAMIQLVMEVSLRMQVVVPLSSEISEIVNETPIVIKLVQGEIPEYFYGSHNVSGDGIVLPNLGGK